MMVLRAFLYIALTVLAVVTAGALYRWMEAFSYDAFVPGVNEVPVFIRKTIIREEAPTSTPLSIEDMPALPAIDEHSSDQP
jgi:hypothetical protein